jgi:chromosome condensin MukBEF MukE localization factor
MMDRAYAGARCRTVRHINTRDGLLPRDTQSTIRYELDNVDRHLVFVDWDNHLTVLVFAEEIEILRHPEGLAA